MKHWSHFSFLGWIVLVGVTACTEGQPSTGPSPATNLLSPAPVPAPPIDAPGDGQCFPGIIRADSVAPQDLAEVLGPYVPRWLPDGFGLLHGYQGDGSGMQNGIGAVWSDATCRQIQLEILPGAADREAPRLNGEWALIGDGTCTIAPLFDVRCFDYHAQDDGEVLNLMTVGVSERDAARVVAGVPLAG